MFALGLTIVGLLAAIFALVTAISGMYTAMYEFCEQVAEELVSFFEYHLFLSGERTRHKGGSRTHDEQHGRCFYDSRELRSWVCSQGDSDRTSEESDDFSRRHVHSWVQNGVIFRNGQHGESSRLVASDRGKIRLRREDVENLVSKGYNTMALLRTFHLWQMTMFCAQQQSMLSSMLNESCQGMTTLMSDGTDSTTLGESLELQSGGSSERVDTSGSPCRGTAGQNCVSSHICLNQLTSAGMASPTPLARRLYIRALGASIEKAASLGSSINESQDHILKETLEEARTYSDLLKDCEKTVLSDKDQTSDAGTPSPSFASGLRKLFSSGARL